MRNTEPIHNCPPLVLDFDGSVLPLGKGEKRLSLSAWQEAVRFGCSWKTYSRLEQYLHSVLPDKYGCVFTGSGDFHHLTYFLLREMGRRKNLESDVLDVIVCDNHPDNMRYPFGLHCGSWVSHAARLPFVRHIHVIGICSPDIGLRHAWENRLLPFLCKKLTYWSIGVNASWLSIVARHEHSKYFSSPKELVDAFTQSLVSKNLYLSIDKDVFSANVVRTNWDQGVFEPFHLEALIAACGHRIIAADICGDVSDYTYATPYKRILSILDGQKKLGATDVHDWQHKQQSMNVRLLDLLQTAPLQPARP